MSRRGSDTESGRYRWDGEEPQDESYIVRRRIDDYVAKRQVIHGTMTVGVIRYSFEELYIQESYCIPLEKVKDSYDAFVNEFNKRNKRGFAQNYTFRLLAGDLFEPTDWPYLCRTEISLFAWPRKYFPWNLRIEGTDPDPWDTPSVDSSRKRGRSRDSSRSAPRAGSSDTSPPLSPGPSQPNKRDRNLSPISVGSDADGVTTDDADEPQEEPIPSPLLVPTSMKTRPSISSGHPIKTEPARGTYRMRRPQTAKKSTDKSLTRYPLPKPNYFHVNVRQVSGTQDQLDVNGDLTIQGLIELYARRVNLPASDIHLVWRGKIATRNRTLIQEDITNGALLHAVIRKTL
ncbi:hypothetical protein BZG36_03244 [Bifiguratus adelaidae]|uniref:Ubiquitin-like domain-containing protein n=1 Tax=Bifiguratus adelaidae TaxID=1938954 RepID=A0A261Y0D0_9FUNG|nr:hypothetical protein BZG36_03244 [Bifiguratus adelaidae]